MSLKRGRQTLCTRCEKPIKGALRLVIDFEGRAWCLDCSDRERVEM